MAGSCGHGFVIVTPYMRPDGNGVEGAGDVVVVVVVVVVDVVVVGDVVVVVESTGATGSVVVVVPVRIRLLLPIPGIVHSWPELPGKG